MRFKILASSLMMFAATVAQAGTMTPTLVVEHRYSAAGDPLTFTQHAAGVDPGQPGIYEVAVFFNAAKTLTDEKGWLSTAFDLAAGNVQGPGTMTLDTSLAAYQANAHQTDTNGASLGGVQNIYGTNQDAGTPGDYQGIVAALVSSQIADASEGGNVNDHRNDLGTANAPTFPGVGTSTKGAGYSDPFDGSQNPTSNNPTWVGSFFVNWNGLGYAEAQLKNLQFAFSQYNGDADPLNDSAGQTTTIIGVNAFARFGIPEPATLSLVGLALLGALGLVRRR